MCGRLRRNTILGLFITIVSAVCFSSCDKLPYDVNVSEGYSGIKYQILDISENDINKHINRKYEFKIE